jgi:hypothetical protein
MVRSTQKDYGEGTLKNSYWITDASHPSTIANLGYRPADETAPPDYSNNPHARRKMTIKLLERPETDTTSVRNLRYLIPQPRCPTDQTASRFHNTQIPKVCLGDRWSGARLGDERYA